MIELFAIWIFVLVTFTPILLHRWCSKPGPPTVPYILPWVGVAIEYGQNSVKFLSRCQERFGPVFNVLITGFKITIICSEEGIKNAFRDKTGAFGTYAGHQQVLRAIGGVKGDAVHLMNDQLFPIIARTFTTSDGLASIAPRFNEKILTTILARHDACGAPAHLPLNSLIGRCLFETTSRVVFGDRFPTCIYPDFQAIDDRFALLMAPIPFVARKVVKCRDRVVHSLAVYIQQSWTGSSLEGASPMANEMFSIIREAGLPSSDEAGVLLSFMWGLHSNTINTTYWLFAYLLSDRTSFERIRDEIDSNMDTIFGGDINTFLSSPPSALGSTDFPLMDSAIKETLRLTILMSSLREAQKDTEILYGDGKRAFIRKGGLILLNMGAAQRSSREWDEGLDHFRIDRYVPDQTQTQTPAGQQPLFFGFGGGAHMCKGRYYALHQVKVFLILCISLFDMTLLDETGKDLQGSLPPPDPTIPGIARPSKQLSIRMKRRESYGKGSTESRTIV